MYFWVILAYLSPKLQSIYIVIGSIHKSKFETYSLFKLLSDIGLFNFNWLDFLRGSWISTHDYKSINIIVDERGKLMMEKFFLNV